MSAAVRDRDRHHCYIFRRIGPSSPNNKANFRDYLAGFSANVQDVLSKFDFDTVIRRMVESNTLYLTIREIQQPEGLSGSGQDQRGGLRLHL